jgi:hypothetical protein
MLVTRERSNVRVRDSLRRAATLDWEESTVVGEVCSVADKAGMIEVNT